MAIFAKKHAAKVPATESTNGVERAEVAPVAIAPEIGEPTLAPAAVADAVTAGAEIAKPAGVESEAVESAVAGAAATAGPTTASDGTVAADIEPEDIEPEPAFGIADAIQLMRSLPNDPNMELVVRVVRVTLGAVDVSVEEILQDAARREKKIQDSIAVLQGHVADLEKQLYAKRCEIAAHEADLQETVSVRERLYQADKYTGNRPPPAPLAATRVPPPRPGELGHSDHSKTD